MIFFSLLEREEVIYLEEILRMIFVGEGMEGFFKFFFYYYSWIFNCYLVKYIGLELGSYIVEMIE